MMKILNTRNLGAALAIAITAFVVIAQQASAGYVSQVVTSAGSTGTLDITGDAFLQSLTADGVTYTNFTPIGVNDPNPAELLYGSAISIPASISAAISDGNLSTGGLNNGTDSIYDLSAGVGSGSLLYLFGNGGGAAPVLDGNGDATGSGGTTPFGIFSFRDNVGTVIGTLDSSDHEFQDPPTDSLRAPNLLTFDFTRGNGNALSNRRLSGFVMPLANIAFEPGFGFGDIDGFSISSGSTDVQDVGLVSVPEPASLVLMGLASLAMLTRRSNSSL